MRSTFTRKGRGHEGLVVGFTGGYLCLTCLVGGAGVSEIELLAELLRVAKICELVLFAILGALFGAFVLR